MQKVYLLLRNNQQTGPYNLGELSQLQLKNTDLIWIEGKSAGWYYPYEVEELKPIVEQSQASITTQTPPVPQPTKEIPLVEAKVQAPVPPKKIYVSLPNNTVPPKPVVTETKPAEVKAEAKEVDEIEKRAEELKRRLQGYPTMKEQNPSVLSTQQEPIKKEVPPSTNTFFDLDEVPTYAIHPKPSPAKKKESVISKPKTVYDLEVTDSAQDLYDNTPTYPVRNRRNSSSNAMQYVAVLFMLALVLGAGWWMYKTFSVKEQQLDDATQQVVKGVQQTVPSDSAQNDGNSVAVNQYGDTSTSAGTGKATPAANPATDPPKVNQPALHQPSQQANAITDNKAVVENNAGKETNEPATVQPTTENSNPVPIVVAKKEEPKIENTIPQTTQEPEKKGGFFKKLFGKRNTDEVSAGAASSGGDGERNATKRDEGVTTAAPVEMNITDQVEIKMNVPDDKWMMGVQGVKLKMFNRSNLELKRAAVEVIYYNDQNDVIDRKSVYFSGIPAGKSRTIAAPDHKFADHAGFNVVNAVGAQK